MLRIAICDDEQQECEKLLHFLKHYFSQVPYEYSVEEYHCGQTLLCDYQENEQRFDLIFMDIYMDGMLGIETARLIRRLDRDVAIVFLTTTPEFALEGYDVQAYGYLVKPFDTDKTKKLLEQFLEREFLENQKNLVFKENRKIVKIPFREIEYIESRRNVLLIHLTDSSQHKVYTKLDDVWQELKAYGFLRCHKSFIINMNLVQNVDKEFFMKSGVSIPIRQRELKAMRDVYFKYILERADVSRI